jgi:hypothetical protein
LQDKHEELQLRQAELEERRKKESDLKRRLERELDDLERELRGTREEMDLQIIASKKEKRELQASFQLALETKQKVRGLPGLPYRKHADPRVDFFLLIQKKTLRLYHKRKVI